MIQDIRRPVEQEVARFHERFEELLLSRSQWLGQAVEHLRHSSGKMVRPIMTTLMAGMLRQRVPELAITSAILLELIHTATLIHDDVIDQAQTRRRRPTLNAIFDNRVAVLMGDFILSSALIQAIQTQNLRIIEIVSSIGRVLTEGEIRQYESAELLILSEENYMEVIEQKTAILFESCAKVAGISCEASQEEIRQLGRCGWIIGIIFQIRDDIFDYHNHDVGKPTGHDIAEGKITLPLLHALLEDKEQTSEGIACWEIVRTKQYSQDNIDRLITFAKERGGIEYATNKMHTLASEAQAILNTFEDNLYRQSLLSLIDYIIARTW